MMKELYNFTNPKPQISQYVFCISLGNGGVLGACAPPSGLNAFSHDGKGRRRLPEVCTPLCLGLRRMPVLRRLNAFSTAPFPLKYPPSF